MGLQIVTKWVLDKESGTSSYPCSKRPKSSRIRIANVHLRDQGFMLLSTQPSSIYSSRGQTTFSDLPPVGIRDQIQRKKVTIWICKSCYRSCSQIVIRTGSGELVDRISPWASYVVKPPKHEGLAYHWKFWNPPSVSFFCLPDLEKHSGRLGSLQDFEKK